MRLCERIFRKTGTNPRGISSKEKTASEGIMKYERFGLYDLELWLRKHWKLCLVIAAVVIAAVVVCTQPLVTEYHRTFSGYELHYEPEAGLSAPSSAEPAEVRLDGTVRRYLFRPDVFEGELFISGFERVQDDWAVEYLERWPDSNLNIRIESDGKVTEQVLRHTGLGGDFTRGEEEKIMRVWACLDRGKEFFCLEIMRPGIMTFGDYDCIIVPAEYETEADRLFRTWVLGDLMAFWESVWATASGE